MKKKNVGIIFGGKSAEHEVSVRSAGAVYGNIDRTLFDTSLIYIDRSGKWMFVDHIGEEGPSPDPGSSGSFIPWENAGGVGEKIDIYFPVLHGPNGEDGRIQGIFEMAGVPFAGAGSLSSNLAMDKSVSKILFRNAGLNVPEFRVFRNNDAGAISEEIGRSIGFPCYIKPCSLGSSVGITRAANDDELRYGIREAFRYDIKIIVEEEIRGREYEVSVMGNDNPVASSPGSFIPSRAFYDYEDKYILDKTEFIIPADLPKEKSGELKAAAVSAYRSLGLNGFSRVDFFIENGTDRIVINEINTIPGFTRISMFPKLWEVDGISFRDLITRLIGFGFEHSEKIYSKVHSPG